MDKNTFWLWVSEQLDKIGLGDFAEGLRYFVNAGLLFALWFMYKEGQRFFKNRKEKKEKEEKEAREREAREAEEKRRLKILKDLHPYFNEKVVLLAQEHFIETKGQNVPPSKEQEPERKHAFVARTPLIEEFIDSSFDTKGSDERFFLVLADSGMGKTTFMINLYLRYLERTRGESFQIKLFPLSYPDVDKEIGMLVEKGEDKRTILLLDAFDEDPLAVANYRERMDQLVELCKNFREVLITSRTQFFPNEDSIPGEISVPKPGTQRPGFHRFKVMYVSPFDKADIEQYLAKKYPENTHENEVKREKAKAIVARSPKLMVRPMLLSNMDDFLEDPKKEYRFAHEIYEVLIQKWIEREGGRKSEEEREDFMDRLKYFSLEFAEFIYTKKWKEEQSLLAKKEEIEEFGLNFHPALSELDIRSRSLLNRDAEGKLKFSHKSILEYYLARIIKDDFSFLEHFSDFDGWDMVELFLQEFGLLPEMVSIEGGIFQLGGKKDFQLSSFEIGKYPVTQAQWEVIRGSNPSHFKAYPNCPVENISWKEVQVFIEKLNQLTRANYRLPTEAEWEYAARGGQLSEGFVYAGSDNLDQVGWFGDNSNRRTHSVGEKKPNELGLYDMSGNVWEWCQDWYGDHPPGPLNDPRGPDSGRDRVLRGGSWFSSASLCRVSDRLNGDPSYRGNNDGFRLARGGSRE